MSSGGLNCNKIGGIRVCAYSPRERKGLQESIKQDDTQGEKDRRREDINATIEQVLCLKTLNTRKVVPSPPPLPLMPMPFMPMPFPVVNGRRDRDILFWI
jgi:hypothetical protein